MASFRNIHGNLDWSKLNKFEVLEELLWGVARPCNLKVGRMDWDDNGQTAIDIHKIENQNYGYVDRGSDLRTFNMLKDVIIKSGLKFLHHGCDRIIINTADIEALSGYVRIHQSIGG